MGVLGLLLVLSLGVLGIVFGSITLWKWMELHEGGTDSRLRKRVEQLEAQVASLQDQVAEALLAADEQPWSRLQPVETPTRSADA